MTAILLAKGVGKTYSGEERDVTVLSNVSFSMEPGETVAIVGPSGSGKTTLLSLCAGLEHPTTGSISLLDQDMSAMTEDERAVLRNREVGFVFQSFHLMPSLTALENVMLPLELSGKGDPGSDASALLDQVGLGSRLHHYPAQLSGGEQQRVAIARAFINKPKILFADEPTGNLDRETGRRIVELLFDLNREHATTLLLITHDEKLAERTGRIFRIEGGLLTESQSRRGQE